MPSFLLIDIAVRSQSLTSRAIDSPGESPCHPRAGKANETIPTTDIPRHGSVFFSAFIPYYSDCCYPLFQLLRKGAKWTWSAECETAFLSLKEALQQAPVLGHPIEGLPYRLYTDASDEALGCALQQVQPIKIRDLKGTRTYEQLRKACDAEKLPPKLMVQLSVDLNDNLVAENWNQEFDNTTVYVERVIAYWSRTFKSAEVRYSTTEREGNFNPS